MSFSWIPIVLQTTSVSSSHILELRNNINTVRSLVGLGSFSWTDSIAVGSSLKSTTFSDIRSAIDQSNDSNICSTDMAIHNVTHNVTYYSTDKNSHFSGYCASNYSYYSTKYATDYAGQYSGYCGSNYSTVFSSWCNTYWSARNM